MIFRIIIIAVAVILVANFVVGYRFFRFALGRKPSGEIPEWTVGITPEIWSITAKDGVILKGYFFRAGTEAIQSNKTAVLVHGYHGFAQQWDDVVKHYCEDGLNVFVADNRAHGASGGRYVGMGWLDKDDYLSWLPLIIEKTGSDCSILLHGVSMGGATVMMLSGEKLPPQVKCIIEDCGYTLVFDEFANVVKKWYHLPPFPLLYTGGLFAKFIAGYSLKEASSLSQLRKNRLPIFFIHGGDDDFVPTKMVYQLYEAAVGVDKELWVLPGVQHALSYQEDPGEYFRRVRTFYRKYIIFKI
ncbi:alpha/beta hydrolase [Spirochaetia bacterium]|nr:alpha/beta hydrolase [Spirochaetia bacterium]